MQILNKGANVRDDICFRISSKGELAVYSKEYVEKVMKVFEELRKENKSISSVEDLGRANELVKAKALVRIKTLETQRNAGFALVGSVTTIGILVMGLLIFMAIKLFIIG